MRKLNAKQLRAYKKNPSSLKLRRAKRNPIYIILDNVLDTYNVGSIFRLADAVAAEKVILCGETQVPPNSRIKKASINTTQWVKWQYSPTAVEAIAKLKIENCPAEQDPASREKLKIVCVEQDTKSIPYTKMKVGFPVAIVVGNETYGVSKEVLKMCDEIVELPMYGVNISLNVMASLAIVLYKLIESENLPSLR